MIKVLNGHESNYLLYNLKSIKYLIIMKVLCGPSIMIKKIIIYIPVHQINLLKFGI
jgi:hypothetical protein